MGCGDAVLQLQTEQWETAGGCRMHHSPIAPQQNTTAGCQDAKCSVAAFLRQDVIEKVCMEGRIFSPFFKHHPGNDGNRAKA